MTQVTPQLARSAWGLLETLHVVAFFAPEVQQAYDRFGVPATRAGYFAARSSAFGAAHPALVLVLAVVALLLFVVFPVASSHLELWAPPRLRTRLGTRVGSWGVAGQ
ncbi:MAG: helix-turn-helix domain-containing protein [Solirubrobacteraceae bacterium]